MLLHQLKTAGVPSLFIPLRQEFTEGGPELTGAEEIASILTKIKVRYQSVPLKADVDVTPCLMNCKEGDLLMSYMAYLDVTKLCPQMYQKVVDELKEQVYWQTVDGTERPFLDDSLVAHIVIP